MAKKRKTKSKAIKKVESTPVKKKTVRKKQSAKDLLRLSRNFGEE